MKSILGLDIFGQKFSFFVLGNEKNKTFLGLVLSIILLVLAGIFIFLFGSDFFNKTNPIINYQNIIALNDTRELLNNENFLIPWIISDSNSNYINTTGIIYPIINYFSYELVNGSFIGNYTPLNYSFCNPKYEKLIPGISQYFCIDNTENLTFGGSWGGSFVNYFSIVLSYCPDGTYNSSSNCTPFEVMNNLMQSEIYFGMFYPDLNFRGDDINQPLRLNYLNYYYRLGLGLQKTDRLYFEKAYIFDDQGYILQENKTSEIYYGKTLKNDFQVLNRELYYADGTSSVFYDCIFYLDKNYDLYTRSYMKIQGVAAIVGGFLNILHILCLTITKIYNRPLLDLKLLKEIFDFSHDQEIIFNQSCNSKLENKSNFSFKVTRENRIEAVSLDAKKKILRNDAENPAKKIELKQAVISVNGRKIERKQEFPSLIRILIDKYLCGKWVKKETQIKLNCYKLGLEYLNNKLDVVYYLHTLDIIEDLRNIILNESQSLALNLKNKPNLMNCKTLDKIRKKFTGEDLFKDSLVVLEYFLSKFRQNDLVGNDLLLFNLLDENLKKLINNEKLL